MCFSCYKEDEKQVSVLVLLLHFVAFHPDVTAAVRPGQTDVREEFPRRNLLMREKKNVCRVTL